MIQHAYHSYSLFIYLGTIITGKVIVSSFSAQNAEVKGDFGGDALLNECYGEVCTDITIPDDCVDPRVEKVR